MTAPTHYTATRKDLPERTPNSSLDEPFVNVFRILALGTLLPKTEAAIFQKAFISLLDVCEIFDHWRAERGGKAA